MDGQTNPIPDGLVTEIHAYYHDLQYFVRALTELSVVKIAQNNDLEFLRNRLADINGFSIIMSAKTNFLKYLTLQSGDLPETEIQVHRVLFRISKGAKQIARSNNRQVTISVTGESYGTISGPDIFEFIPYLILENAVKYCPKRGSIGIDVHDHQKTIDWNVESLGPEVEPDELPFIFNQGFRGRNAKKYTPQGAGMGLYHARMAIERFYDGTISATQRTDSAPILIGDIPFRHTRFSVSIPRKRLIS
jgi:signal transduction histidine kinase